MTLRTLDLALWRRADEAREMALRPSFRLVVHNRAKCDIGKHSHAGPGVVRSLLSSTSLYGTSRFSSHSSYSRER